MPRLDVSDILLDRDFAEMELRCERNFQEVTNGGVAVVDQEFFGFPGVVTSDKGDVLHRGADGERVVGNIIIHTPVRLQDGTMGYTADIVEWNGRRYTVVNVNDYSRYGRGFTAASCELIPLSG